MIHWSRNKRSTFCRQTWNAFYLKEMLVFSYLTHHKTKSNLITNPRWWPEVTSREIPYSSSLTVPSNQLQYYCWVGKWLGAEQAIKLIQFADRYTSPGFELTLWADDTTKNKGIKAGSTDNAHYFALQHWCILLTSCSCSLQHWLCKKKTQCRFPS